MASVLTTAAGRCCWRSGLTPQEALASTMMRAGSISNGRDVGVVFNLPRTRNVTVLPGCGGVGAQYTPTVGWAQALVYRARRWAKRKSGEHRGGSRR